VTCHLEWDLLGGLMCAPRTHTPACLILCGHGGVVGDAAEVVASAGAGSGGTDTPGGKGKIS